MTEMKETYRILPLGDSAVTVEFENEISIEVNQKVYRLKKKVEQNPVDGILETVPAYRSLTVYYNPVKIGFRQVCGWLREKLEEKETEEAVSALVLELPVCYGGLYGPDLEEVAAYEKLTPQEVIQKHSEEECFVYFVGFSPGNAYIGSQKQTFHVPRRQTPRVMVPAGSVTVWQSQTTVFPMDQPGGWNIIGRTPLAVFRPEKEDPFLLKAGQWVKFRPIQEKEYLNIEEQVRRERYRVRRYERKARHGSGSD